MKKYVCENCGNEHDGSYGSGRFCSKHCKCSFNAKKVKTRKTCQIGKHKRAKYGTWKCDCCDLIFETRAQLKEHNHHFHPIPKGSSWNKGLTKDTDERVAKFAEKTAESYRSGVKVHPWKGKHHSAETKQKISSAMKKAHVEGRAWNIGMSRWNNEPSYPEKWFMEVIANEFENKQYEREVPFHRFSLDFAWKDLKRCIEIDGKQHYEDSKQHERDLCKDALLKEEGWKVLRIDWRKCFKDPKTYIRIAKDFIDS